MGCNTTRANCSPAEVFAATAIPACSQFIKSDQLQAEQLVFDQAFNDLINSYGIGINYYINTFNLSAANLVYGEHPTKKFEGPMELQMYVEIDNEAITLSKFGFDAADEFTGYVHITTFTETASAFFNYASIGQDIEPKAGDLIEVTGLGCDRPNGRGAKIYEITERRDDDISTINPMLGHYVYRVRAKRFEYSYENGITDEPANEQVYDNSFSGILSTTLVDQLTSSTKSYPDDVDVESATNVFDMDVNNNDIYGDYY